MTEPSASAADPELRDKLAEVMASGLRARQPVETIAYRLLPVVVAYVEQQARERAAEELEKHDFPPDEANDGPGPDGHHTVTGECFACMVGVSTGPESHGDRCAHAAALRGQA